MIDGLTIYEHWITEEEEKSLIENMPKIIDCNVFRYGKIPPEWKHLDSEEIPPYLSWLNLKLVEDGILKEPPDYISLRGYRIGEGMAYHVDSESSGEIVTVLSILGSGNMGLKNPPKELNLELAPRTLVKMENEARWEWAHCIHPVSEPRWSIGFRNITK